MAAPTVAMDMEEAKELHPLVEPLTESSTGRRLPRGGLALAAAGLAAASVAALAYTGPWTSGAATPATHHSFGSGWQQLSEAHARALKAVASLSRAEMEKDVQAARTPSRDDSMGAARQEACFLAAPAAAPHGGSLVSRSCCP
jgi:hypothetical protein